MPTDSQLDAMVQLRESEARYKALFAGAAEGILVADVKAKQFRYANPALCRMFGYTEAEITRLGVTDIHPKESLDHVLAEFEAQARGGKTLVHELPCLRKDGTVFYADINTAPMTLDGCPCNVGSFTDVTERKRAEDALRESEERFRSIFEDGPLGMAISSPQFLFVRTSNTFCRMLGYTHAELARLTFKDITHPDHLQQDVAQIERLARGDIRVYKTEKRYLRKNGDTLWGALTVSAIHDTHNAFAYYLVMIEDITERKRAEEAIGEAQRFNEAIMQTSPIGIVTYDASGLCLSANDAAGRIVGTTAEALKAENFHRIETWKQSGLYSAAMKALDTNRPVPAEIEMHTTFGKDRWLSIVCTPFQSGGEQNLLLMFADITEHKRADQQIQASLREKETLLKEIHHRVKNNLQVICSLLNLQATYVNASNATALFKDSQNRIRSMALIHEALYSSSALATIDFNVYVRNLVGELKIAYPLAPERTQIHIHVERITLGLDQAVPCGLILNELITNSLKYAFPHGRQGNIEIEMTRDQQRCVLRVRDDGVGLPPAVDFVKPTSFGLKLVRILATQLGGTIDFDRRQGTSCWIQFDVG